MTSPKPSPGEPDVPGAKGLRADARRNRARILAAAAAVFAEKGPSASTDEVAVRAGLAIGTVFKHFPTKQALLQAIMKDLLADLTREVEALAADGDPATSTFGFMTRMVEQAAEKKTVVGLLAEAGIDLQVADSLHPLRDGIAELLARSQRAGAVREDVGVDEVVALLTGVCQGALHAGWDRDLQRRTLAVVFDGLRPPGARRPT
ncbi:TetR/AcrR family transcriptional regulator [Streptosporangium sp. NBC_01756]|uniref:TetR/AcrR family transcriptional regulator n=1 Tax=Streptosporangium sp. NBC_01756 TaxID=2975950 RepID=UPI002DD86A03|nr:TetR/AcrR family transcriptional regulator [Streptosporangium sp. NBC_01756]WSC85466.1 TetR/AcrR family transcriptional regulator [Streptosporangium sp. NBC_01756]